MNQKIIREQVNDHALHVFCRMAWTLVIFFLIFALKIDGVAEGISIKDLRDTEHLVCKTLG